MSALDFVSLDQAGTTQARPTFHPGVALFAPDGSWHASLNGGDLHTSNGHGAPNDLPKGLWLTDLPFEQISGVSARGRYMKVGPWLRPGIDSMCKSWGITSAPRASAASMLSRISSRIFARIGDIAERDTELGIGPEDLRRILSNAPSLTTGIAQMNALRLNAAMPSDPIVQNVLKRCLQTGIYFPKWAKQLTGMRRIDFSLPLLSHALLVTSEAVPAPTVWRFAARPDDMSGPALIAELKKGNRPAIVEASITAIPPGTPEWIESFIHGRQASIFRYHFSIGEIEAILARGIPVQITSVIAGQDWQPSATGVLLNHLVAAAGGPLAAAASWSVNALAENILCSAFRPLKGVETLSTEAIWIATRDRNLMLPYIDALSDSGARLISAMAGVISVEVPDDVEIISSVLMSAWDMGLHTDLDTASGLLKDKGIKLPTDISSWGGTAVDYLPAVSSHSGNRNALWKMDGLQDLPIGGREQIIKASLP
jgi:hypothetical protein